MLQLIVLIVFLASLLGILLILFRKIPILAKLPHREEKAVKNSRTIKGKIGDAYVDFFEKQILLHKLLSKLKVLVLRIEQKIDVILHGIRKKSQEVEKKTRRKRNNNSPII